MDRDGLTTDAQGPVQPPAPGEEARARTQRSITQIDENATQAASDTQSASDAEDEAARSPADEGGEA
jgi:hypothetical protein